MDDGVKFSVANAAYVSIFTSSTIAVVTDFIGTEWKTVDFTFILGLSTH